MKRFAIFSCTPATPSSHFTLASCGRGGGRDCNMKMKWASVTWEPR